MANPSAIPSSPTLSPEPLLPPLSPLTTDYIYTSPYGDLLSTYSEGFYNEEYRTWDGDLAMEDLSSFLETGERLEERTHNGEASSGKSVVSESLERETLQPPSDSHHQEQVGWLEMEMQQWGGMAKAARSKRRIARQMSNCSIPRFVLPRRISSSSSISSPSSSSPSSFSRKTSRKNFRGLSAVTKNSPINIFPPLHMGLRHILHKELKNSDVTSLGRIVLPKRESEIYLPFLAVKEGIQITVRDMFSPDAWRMRYRFWPNNKSRMYVLENTGDYIKKNGLSCGDIVALYQDECKQLYICARKAGKPQYAMETKENDQDMALKGGMLGGNKSTVAPTGEMVPLHEDNN